VSGPGTRLTASRIPDVAAHCMAQANALSAVLGHRRDGPPPWEGPPHAQREGAA
jgi:hypothetical protein